MEFWNEWSYLPLILDWYNYNIVYQSEQIEEGCSTMCTYNGSNCAYFSIIYMYNLNKDA